MQKLDQEKLDESLTSSFSSIRETVYHLWSAEFIWLQRLELAEHPVWIEAGFEGTFEDACADWQKVSEVLLQFVRRQYDDRAFEHTLQYYDKNKKSHKTPVYMVLQQIFNHSTYHRGQLVTLLRQLGVKRIPNTDFISFK